jgi:glyoxylase I family protein
MCVIQHVAFNCKNKIKMEQFYTKHFGFRRARVFNAGSEDEFVMLRLENMCIELFWSTGDRPVSTSENAAGFRHIAFAVHDLNYMVNRLIADEVKVGEIIDYSKSVAGLRICFFDDPEGNKVEIMQGWSDDETLSA